VSPTPLDCIEDALRYRMISATICAKGTRMGLFSRKQRVLLEVFCRDFYDRNILGGEVSEVYFQQRLTSVAAADARFAAVDSKRFRAEMMPIHLEVFGLAWLHQLGHKHAARQSYCTKLLLEARNKADIWKAMEPYSQAVARSGELYANRGQSVRFQRARVVGIDLLRMRFFEQWCEQGFESDAVAQAVRRLGTLGAWKQGLTSRLLLLTLCERLGCEVKPEAPGVNNLEVVIPGLNKEAMFRLEVVIQGLYDGARAALKAIRVVA